MNDAGKQHKRAWEYDAYNFWVKHNGTPEVRAKEDVENPTKMLRKYASYFDHYIRSFMNYRMELRLTMEIAVQKCLMQHVRMKEEFVFMEKWQINRFQLRELELNYAGGEKKW